MKMEKVDFMVMGTIVKFVLAFIGVVATLVLLVTGLANKNNKIIAKSGLIFLLTCGMLIVLSTIEFLLLANW